ncbi:integrase catalytic domain-containing protein [Trichonephila clavipes]|nr:integrase catalytic domain-containing protein [Trichonephila clavipes]
MIRDYEFENLIETETLGLSWNSQEDCFIFKIAVELKDSYTKRCVLSTIARLFDPLGLLCSVVARASCRVFGVLKSTGLTSYLLREPKSGIISLRTSTVFIANCRGERRGPLDVQEINRAEITLIRIVPLQEFKRDIKSPQGLLYQVRQRFWPLRGCNVCRKRVHDCLVCFKVKPITCEQVMSNLPKERVRENFLFDCSGINFIGPFWIKNNKQLKSSLYKTYVSIFVCFVTKAAHFELVSDLTTQAFIASFKRFIARRGRPTLIFSDNGKIFIGANAELKRLYKLVINPYPELAVFSVDENINWRFLPPRAPNFGGLWEAGIMSFKFHFKHEAGNSRFTYEEFLTIIT